MEITLLRKTDYPGVKVSNRGKVFKNGKELRQREINSGYLVVQVFGQYRDGNRKRELVHRLVAKAFVGGYKPGLQVNHKDGNRKNNNPYNLEWVTAKENIHDMMNRGTMNYTKAQSIAQVKNQKTVNQYNLKGTFIKRWNSVLEAEKELFGKKSKIGMVANGKRNLCGGYIWRWANDDDIV